jgi:hypothetical protein
MVRKNVADEALFELKTSELPGLRYHSPNFASTKLSLPHSQDTLIHNLYAIKKKRFRRRFPEHQPAGRLRF